ncbi:MAG: hypothetical protein ACYTAF_14365, partial [Planctomycetota bacterium]
MFLSLTLLILLCPQQDDVLSWIEDLRSDGEAKRRSATAQLVAAGDRAVPGLLAALRHERPGLEARVGDLVGKLGDADWKVRDAAMKELTALGRHARSALRKHREHGNPEVALRVRTALARIEERSGEEGEAEHRRDALICEILAAIGDRRCVPD